MYYVRQHSRPDRVSTNRGVRVDPELGLGGAPEEKRRSDLCVSSHLSESNVLASSYSATAIQCYRDVLGRVCFAALIRGVSIIVIFSHCTWRNATQLYYFCRMKYWHHLRVASLGWVSPGAVTDGVTPIFVCPMQFMALDRYKIT